jgi:hypothetical protein
LSRKSDDAKSLAQTITPDTGDGTARHFGNYHPEHY